jgi:hypothetical protein
MHVREGHHATRCCDPHDHAIPIDHSDHEDHDPARERMKGVVCREQLYVATSLY